MDGLRMGLPILVHKVSARGYDVFFEKPYFKVYEDRESFKHGLQELLRFSSKGFNRSDIQTEYLLHFSFKAGRERVNKIIKDLAYGTENR